VKIQYLEIVTEDIESVCATYRATNRVAFSEPIDVLGGARTATLADGSLLGVRAPMSDAEEPIVRPYWLVDDIEKSVGDVAAAGGEIAHPPLALPGYGTFAIYIQGGVQHGLWQLK